MTKIEKFAEMIRECENIVFFGGAGVSTESGIKDYRSADGLYNTVKDYSVSPETILSHNFFFSETEVFYDFYRKYFASEVQPNKAHAALAYLEKTGKVKAVITQNVDGLHQQAGSSNVVELHGTTSEFFCCDCKRSVSGQSVIGDIRNGCVPLCDSCGGIMRPKVVLYGEQLHDGVAEKAVNYIDKADMLVIGGTSLAVYPAAAFLEYFRGKYIVMINKAETEFDHKANLVINDSIGKTFEEVLKLL